MRLWKLSAEVSAKIVSDLDPAKIASFNIGSTLDDDTAITVWSGFTGISVIEE